MYPVGNEQLYHALTELNVVDAKVLKDLFEASEQQHTELASALLERDLVSDANLGSIIADLLKLPPVNLSQTPIDSQLLDLLPRPFAQSHQVVIFAQEEDSYHLALASPQDPLLVSQLNQYFDLPPRFFYATPGSIASVFDRFAPDIRTTFAGLIKEQIDSASGDEKADPPIIAMADLILNYAASQRASDIHLEPNAEEAAVRFRIDGLLHDMLELPASIYPRLLTRIKIIAKLRTDEHQAAQDGKFRFSTGTEELDIRVSIVPVVDGEKTVLRLLSEKSRQFGLDELGMSPADLDKISRAYHKPYGMVLSTGPTGCGKTTTMYAIIKLLNHREVNISTIEDPVEYEIEGVNQIQVNPKTGLTFAKGLRSIVRQDPNIILVGEIRDEDTAGIAINSAMTGHLVLSTLHTNDAATTFPRLIDFGLEPFLVASTINLVIAQRLVRQICSNCRVSLQVDPATLKSGLSPSLHKKYFSSKKARIYQGKGCSVCHQTGFLGRIGIFEVIEIDDDLRAAITSRQDAAVIAKLAIKAGMTTMIEDGLNKVTAGLTTIEEVIRVTKE